jgi:hypothetical protein
MRLSCRRVSSSRCATHIPKAPPRVSCINGSPSLWMASHRSKTASEARTHSVAKRDLQSCRCGDGECHRSSAASRHEAGNVDRHTRAFKRHALTLWLALGRCCQGALAVTLGELASGLQLLRASVDNRRGRVPVFSLHRGCRSGSLWPQLQGFRRPRSGRRSNRTLRRALAKLPRVN